MKQIWTFLLLFAACSHAISQTITWGSPVTVYSVDADHNNHPRIALNRAGDPYIIFGQTDTRVYFTKWNGTSFSSPTVVSGALTVFSQSWAGPDLDAHGDTVYVSMKVTPEMPATSYNYLAHSYNGGTSFSSPVRIDSIGNDISRFPVVTTTDDGNPLIAYMRFDSGTMMNARYMVARSSDYGMTFSNDALASRGTNPVCDCCPATLISKGTKTIMLYRDNNSDIRDMWAGVSNDGGATFTSKFTVDTTNWMINSCPSSGPDGFLRGDSLYTVYMSSASGTALVYLGRTSISGMSASNSRITSAIAGLASQNYPRIANADTSAMAVWVQNVSGSKNVAYSFAGNISSGFAAYSNIPGTTSSGLMNADIAMTPGAVHVVWEDDNSGKVMYIKGTYPLPSKVASLGNSEKIEIYPNPASTSFRVDLPKGVNINSGYLTDELGKTIALKANTTNGNASFSLNGIARGNYTFIMETVEGKTFHSKLLVQ